MAQDPSIPAVYQRWVAPHTPAARLTLRPREMATGTRTEHAGWSELDPLDARRLDSLGLDSLTGRPPRIYVPDQCVGARRCPLFVTVGGVDLEWFVPMADKYGMILFWPAGYPQLEERWVHYLDIYLRQALQQLAIDPDRIAIQGHCGGGTNAYWFGRTNMQVFSRVIAASPESYADAGEEPKTGNAEFLLIASMDDPELQMYYFWLKYARQLRREGLPVQAALSLRPHEHRLEEFDLMGRWLQASWARSGRTGALDVSADSLPVLTAQALTRLTTFWTSFTQEPESVWVAGLMTEDRLQNTLIPNAAALLKDAIIPVGEERVTVQISDFPALAARYSSVAAKLQAAELTAQQAEAIRLALLSARATRHAAMVAPGLAGTVTPGSVLGQNVAFLEAHPDMLTALATPERSAIWTTP